MLRVRIRAVHEQPVHLGLAILKELRDAGVPATGVLWPEGVKHGSLTVERVSGQVIYSWTPDPLLED